MLKLLSWLLFIPVAAVSLIFAVSNRHTVELSVNVIGLSWLTPLYMVGLGGLVLGFIWAACLIWMSAGAARRKAREAITRANKAEAEARRLQTELDQLKKSSSGGQAGESTALTLPGRAA